MQATFLHSLWMVCLGMCVSFQSPRSHTLHIVHVTRSHSFRYSVSFSLHQLSCFLLVFSGVCDSTCWSYCSSEEPVSPCWWYQFTNRRRNRENTATIKVAFHKLSPYIRSFEEPEYSRPFPQTLHKMGIGIRCSRQRLTISSYYALFS